MIDSLDKYIDFLFNCSFDAEDFDPEGNEVHLKTSWELYGKYNWNEIYSALWKYLIENCKTSEEVINFVNLFVYYECLSHDVDSPFDFIGFVFSKVDMDKYWDEAGELFDYVAIDMLSRHNLIDIAKNPYYSPLEDERVLDAISKWKKI